MTKICSQQCPIKITAELIDSKWTTLIVRELLSGTKRYHELQRALEGISSKVLADRLNLLLTQNIITRTEYDTNPPTTEYTLTALGQELQPVLAAMADFGNKIAQVNAS